MNVQYFSRDEVSEHNKDSDAWLICQNSVYNVSNWHQKHPGGSVILHYKGQDATDTIFAFHPDFEKFEKYAKSFKVGELLESERVSKENPKTQLIAEYRELRETFMKEGLFRTNRLFSFFFLNLLQCLLLELLAVLTYQFTESLLLTSLVLCVSQIQAGWLQHDFGHNSVFKTRAANQFWQYVTIGVLKGALCEWWKSRHNRHHSKTNTIQLDPDIHTEPLFSFSEELVQTDKIKYTRNRKSTSSSPATSTSSTSNPVMLSRNPKLKHARDFVKILPYQHYYWFTFGPPLVTTYLFLLENSIFMVTKACMYDIIAVLLFFVRFDLTFCCYLGIAPYKVVLLYFMMRFWESHWFTWVTSMNHLPRPKTSNPPSDWVSLQLTATQNVTTGPWFDWFTGHLNYQIEHHLFPEMPRHNYPLVADRVRELCERHNIEYKRTSMWQSCKEIVGKLRDVASLYTKFRNLN